MNSWDRLQFLINARLVEGDTYLEAVNYRATQFGCQLAYLHRVLDGEKPLTKNLAKEIDELYQISEDAMAKAARFYSYSDISQLEH